MKLELKFLAVAVAAILLAVPVALSAQHRTHQLKIEKSQNSTLHIQLDSKQKQIEAKDKQIQDEKQKNDDLQKQLQSKREAAATIATQAQTAPVVVSTAVSGGCEAYRGIVAQYDWNVAIALAVMHAESGCNPTAVSPTCDHGLMQINCIHADMVDGDLTALNDPATNVRIAYAIYTGRGWQSWTTYTSGAFLRFL